MAQKTEEDTQSRNKDLIVHHILYKTQILTLYLRIPRVTSGVSRTKGFSTWSFAGNRKYKQEDGSISSDCQVSNGGRKWNRSRCHGIIASGWKWEGKNIGKMGGWWTNATLTNYNCYRVIRHKPDRHSLVSLWITCWTVCIYMTVRFTVIWPSLLPAKKQKKSEDDATKKKKIFHRWGRVSTMHTRYSIDEHRWERRGDQQWLGVSCISGGFA